MPSTAPFCFYTERSLVLLTGRKAANLPELARHLAEVSGSSIFYHTHFSARPQALEHPPSRRPSYNEFANWAGYALQEDMLAEQLAAVDPLSMTSIRDLRDTLFSIVTRHLDAGTRVRECPPGQEFHFCEAKSFIMPTGLVAHSVPEFFDLLRDISNASLHFHLFEARLRLDRPTNDFSQWLKDLGEEKLARAIDNLDAYGPTLDGIRRDIAKLNGKNHRK